MTEFIVFRHFTKWTLDLVGKDYVYHIPLVDTLLFRLYPLLLGGIFIITKHREKGSLKNLTLALLTSIPLLIVLILIAYLLGLVLWPKIETESMSSNILQQPFNHYWTPFILIGIFLPYYFLVIKSKKVIPDLLDDVIN